MNTNPMPEWDALVKQLNNAPIEFSSQYWMLFAGRLAVYVLEQPKGREQLEALVKAFRTTIDV